MEPNAYLGVLGSNFEKLWSYLKKYCKITCENKNAKIWDQKYLICEFFGQAI